MGDHCKSILGFQFNYKSFKQEGTDLVYKNVKFTKIPVQTASEDLVFDRALFLIIFNIVILNCSDVIYLFFVTPNSDKSKYEYEYLVFARDSLGHFDMLNNALARHLNTLNVKVLEHKIIKNLNTILGYSKPKWYSCCSR